MKENKNISSVRQRFEPSSELKNRVIERAAKLEAGRKTFGIEMTTADNQEINKEQIKMNAYNTNEKAKVKRHFPIAVISVAACAAIVVGLAAVNMNEKKPKTMPMSSTDSLTTDDQTVTEEDDSISDNVIKVTDRTFGTYYITDKDRIAVINNLVENAKKSHVWDGEEVPTDRTLEYDVDGEKRIVKISEAKCCPAILAKYHSETDYHPELCRIITIDGASYILCEYIPEEHLAELDSTTSKGGYMFFQRNDDDEYYDELPGFAEYDDETTARKLYDIICDISENGTLQFETDSDQPWYECEQLSSLGTSSASNHFELDGNSYSITLYKDSDQIVILASDWKTGNTHTVLYKDARKWISECDEVFRSLKDLPEICYVFREGSELSDTTEEYEDVSDTREEREPSANEARIPELFDMTEEQAVEALKEVGLDGVVEYRFDSAEKGHVFSWYDMSENFDGIVEKGTVIPILVSLGEYDGPNEAINVEFGTGSYPTKDTKLEVSVPEGLKGSYTFDIYYGGNVVYTDIFDSTNGDKSVTFDIQAEDKERFAVYAKKTGSVEESLIRYATYEFDYAAEKWTLIGELNTKELLESMN
jgi:hypothetical protein